LIIKRYWLAILLTAGAIGLIGRVPAVQDSATHLRPPGVSLELPVAYIVSSPLSRTLDALTLLSNPQSIAALVPVALIVVVWRALST
jgi:hypothetical protein